MAKLNAARVTERPMTGEVLWLSAPTAFTLPGPHCYISRRFIERCNSDAPVAFAMAHEIAHHDLGDLQHAEAWAASVAAHAPLRLAALILYRLSQRIYSREMELAADAYALELCRKAGFEPTECLKAFDILTWYLLDHHNSDAVYGTDDELGLDPEQTTNVVNRVFIESRLWLARHRRSHPAIYERRHLLRSQIAGSQRQDLPVLSRTAPDYDSFVGSQPD
jgi:predicted Zn-dependent protease